MDVLKAGISRLQRLINVFLPFTRPETPLLQDVLHTVVLCTLLWYAPQILERRIENDGQNSTQQRDGDSLPPRDLQRDLPVRDDQGRREDPPAPPVLHEDDGLFIPAEEDDIDPAAAVAPHAAFEDDIPDPRPGPAEAPAAGPGPASVRSQNVGKKKAASLARKDQKRAYHEFMRSQGEAQRAREREEASTLEEEREVERARRAKLEEAVESRKRVEREKKRVEEKRLREEEIQRRKRAVELLRRGLTNEGGIADLRAVARDVGGGIDEGTVVALGRAEGLVGGGWRAGELVICTETGYAVRVSEDDLWGARARLVDSEESGIVEWADMNKALQEVVRSRTTQGPSSRGNCESNLHGPSGQVPEKEKPPQTYLDLIPEP
ncbi:MAG: nucleolar DEAD-box protein required for synthesis of 60S ribosomal subunit [Chaenotheca gracillima]|nr:MAG: nucleolar DEAD-box protein required for synthesis of 60S ribosomal subunit [Chaenotheca gracillima]